MATHIANRTIFVAFSPSEDPKWRPDDMEPRKWYQVYGYENGTIKYRDGDKGEAFFFHFIGEGCRPCRLIHGNAVVALDKVPEVFPEHASKANSGADSEFNPG